MNKFMNLVRNRWDFVKLVAKTDIPSGNQPKNPMLTRWFPGHSIMSGAPAGWHFRRDLTRSLIGLALCRRPCRLALVPS